MREHFRLESHEVNSPLWRKLENHFGEQIAMYREQNDSLNNDEQTTVKLRAQIAELKKILALGNPKPMVSGQ